MGNLGVHVSFMGCGTYVPSVMKQLCVKDKPPSSFSIPFISKIPVWVVLSNICCVCLTWENDPI